MTDAERDSDLKNASLEEIAILAARDIAMAILEINKKLGREMVVWPLDITVLNGNGIHNFNFAEMLMKDSLTKCADQDCTSGL